MRFTIMIMVLGVTGIMALPGVAQQATSTGLTPEGRLATMQAEFGLTVDPYAAATLSIVLPTGFTTLDPNVAPTAL